MRILLVLPQIVFGKYGGFVGGYVNSVLNLAEKMQHLCHLELIAGIPNHSQEGERELRSLLYQCEINLILMRSTPTTAKYFMEFAGRAFRKANVSNGKIDFVYGHSGFAGYASVTWLIAFKTGARSIHALYCPFTLYFQHKKVSPEKRLLSWLGVRMVDRLIAISENVAQSVRKGLNYKKQIDCIFPAIAEDLGCSTNPSVKLNDKDTDNGHTPTIGFVGHHLEEKGLDLAIDALRRLNQKRQPFHLLGLVSGGESGIEGLRAANQMAKEAGIEDSVTFVSGIKSIKEFFDQIDLLVVPFRGTKGPSDFPMVLLEGLAMGKITVSTPVGAIPEIIIDSQNGYLASSLEGEALYEALCRALDASQNLRMQISRSAQEVANQFRASNIANKTIQLIQNHE